jgi:peptidoglycan/LPS O-acetylase OafA/YrhL
VKSIMPSQNMTRIAEVDGIRGWAALVVVLFHAFGEMLKYAVPAVHSQWLAPLFAGDVAVSVFFVLSGDALSSAYFAGGGYRCIDRLLVRRYFRLTIPIFMSCLITYCIMVAGLDYHEKAAVILQRPDWLGQFLQFNASIIKFLQYSLIGVYVSHSRELSYNPFLWTMSIEIVGSMLVFLLLYLWERLTKPHLVCIALTLWLLAIGSNFALFFAGVLLGYWRQQGCFEGLLLNSRYQKIALTIVIGVGGGLMLTSEMLKPHWLSPIMMLVAILLVFCFYTQGNLRAFFNNKLSHILGDISFPLYLVHFQVLISLMSYLVVADYSSKGAIDQNAMVRFALVTVLMSLIAAWCFRQLERKILKRIDSSVLRILA